MERRLPVYLLVDCSESMAGTAIAAVQEGVETLIRTLQRDPVALESVYLSIITFAHEARVESPLTELMLVKPPRLRIRCGTAMGQALDLLAHALDHEVRKSSSTTKGDWKPFVFLLTDGQPTDEFDASVRAFRDKYNHMIAMIYAIACGDDVDVQRLYKLTDMVLHLKDIRQETIQKFFFWLTQSVQTASHSVGMAGDMMDAMPPLPGEAVERAPRHGLPGDGRPRQVFLHATCSTTGQPYLMRFIRDLEDNLYYAAASHPLEAEDAADADGGHFEELPPVSSDRLAGVPECPYCPNQGAAVCPCHKKILCTGPIQSPTFKCPICGIEGHVGPRGQSFDIRQSLG